VRLPLKKMYSALGFIYDGDGKRVQKSNGKLYWYGMVPDRSPRPTQALVNRRRSFRETRISEKKSGFSREPGPKELETAVCESQ